MENRFKIPLFDMVMALSSAIDLVSPAVTDHHKRVAYFASLIAAEAGCSDAEVVDIIMAGALHDIGGLTLKDRLDALAFEIDSPHQHADISYRYIKNFKPLQHITDMVRYHHVRWDGGRGKSFDGEEVPFGSHILHISDRVDALINRRKPIKSQIEFIRQMILKEAGGMFMPELVHSFDRLSGSSGFWEGAFNDKLEERLRERSEAARFRLDMDGLLDIAVTFAHIIDFRTRFTAIHSSGVAAVACELAAYCGMHPVDQEKMRIAGHLHDLGKLAVPAEVLNKPGKLDPDEFQLILVHPYFTHMVLKNIQGLETINNWASHHHERIDGKGYPFKHDSECLTLGCKTLSVADVFTALAEDRPYRPGMLPDRLMSVMGEMTDDGALDPEIVSVLLIHFDTLDRTRKSAQEKALAVFTEFSEGITIPH